MIDVQIGIPRPPSPFQRLPAIIDTGAQLAYYIDIERAQEIGLRDIGGIHVTTGSVAGFEYTPAYLAQIHVEPLGVSGRDVPLYGYSQRPLGRHCQPLDLLRYGHVVATGRHLESE